MIADCLGLVLEFPEPKARGEAYFVAVTLETTISELRPDSHPAFRFLALEKGGAERPVFLCERAKPAQPNSTLTCALRGTLACQPWLEERRMMAVGVVKAGV